VVSLWREELGSLLVRLCLFLLWAVEDGLDGEHGHHGEDLLGAAQVDRRDEHLGQLRLQRKLGHLPPESRQQPFLVQRAKRVEHLQRGDERLHRRRVHEVEAEQVVDAHRLEVQNDVREVGALDLGNVVGQHLAAEGGLGVQTET